MASLQELITAWNTGPEEPLKEFYDEVFGGITGGSYAADEDEPLPGEIIAAAKEMATTLNIIKGQFEKVRFTEEGFFNTEYSLSGEDEYWPRLQNPDLENAVDVLQTLVNDLLVLQENPLFYQDYHWGKAFQTAGLGILIPTRHIILVVCWTRTNLMEREKKDFYQYAFPRLLRRKSCPWAGLMKIIR